MLSERFAVWIFCGLTAVLSCGFASWFHATTPKPIFVQAADHAQQVSAPTPSTAPQTFHPATMYSTPDIRDRLYPVDTPTMSMTAPTDSRLSANVTDVDIGRAVGFVQWLPTVFSWTAGIVMGWSAAILIMFASAWIAAVKNGKQSLFKMRYSQIIKLSVVLVVTNTTVLLALSNPLAMVLDSLILWNFGMIAVLVYFSLALLRASCLEGVWRTLHGRMTREFPIIQ